MSSDKKINASLKNSIIAAFFLVAVSWGITTTIINNHLFKKALSGTKLDLDIINQAGRDFTIYNTGTSMVAIILVLMIAIPLANSITQPLLKLINKVKKVSGGNLNVEFDIQSNNEIGALADSLSIMVGKLKKDTTSIDKLNNEIRERKYIEEQLREERDFAQKLVETTQAIVLVLDKEAKIVNFNPYMEDMSGYKLFEVQGKNWFDIFIPEQHKQGINQLFSEHINNGATKNINPIITKDGRIIDIEWHSKALKDANGNTIGMLSTGQDVTNRKRAEEMLQVTNEELKYAASSLETANSELKDFIYIASHDLREPLRKISSFGNLLMDSLKDNLEEDDRENLGFMIDGANRMMKMIEGLLQYSRVNTKDAELEHIDLNKVIEEFKEVELAKLIEETQTTIEVPQELPIIQGVSAHIRQLMQNLICNGIKYHEEGKTPHITVRAIPIDEYEYKIEVHDNGIGIDKKYLSDIFKMFKRLHARTTYEGTGIGLSICRKIVEKHNGKIGVSSTPGEGSTFWFILPKINIGVPENETIKN